MGSDGKAEENRRGAVAKAYIPPLVADASKKIPEMRFEVGYILYVVRDGYHI